MPANPPTARERAEAIVANLPWEPNFIRAHHIDAIAIALNDAEQRGEERARETCAQFLELPSGMDTILCMDTLEWAARAIRGLPLRPSPGEHG